MNDNITPSREAREISLWSNGVDTEETEEVSSSESLSDILTKSTAEEAPESVEAASSEKTACSRESGGNALWSDYLDSVEAEAAAFDKWGKEVFEPWAERGPNLALRTTPAVEDESKNLATMPKSPTAENIHSLIMRLKPLRRPATSNGGCSRDASYEYTK